jgi:peptidoglycan/LPS O-acetylase OafA/YrhL
LDGLRAIAIIGVLLFHLQVRGFSLGWTGVTLFFVLSGFLITGILLDTKGGPHFLRNFYWRRALRIFPIYYVALISVAGIAVLLDQKVGDLPYYLIYAQNYVLGITNFTPNFPIAFNHSWSLAVEEQFYLLWPLAVLWLSRRRLSIVIWGLFGLGLASRGFLLLVSHNADLMDAALPTQLEPLAAGAALAVLTRSGAEIRVIARAGLSVAVASGALLIFMIHANGLPAYWHPDVWETVPANLPTISLLALFFAGVLSVAVAGNTILSNLLRLRFLRHIGKISYGLYMYHFPVFVAVDKFLWHAFPGEPGLVPLAHPVGKIVLTYLVTLTSWKLLESPLLRLKGRFVG